MAKVQIKSERITPFGGIFHVREQFSRFVGPVIDKVLELLWVLGTDVGSLTHQMLRVTDTANQGIDAGIAETGVDDDGTHLRAGWLKQMLTTVDHGGKLVDGGDVVRIFVQTEELVQLKMG